MTTVIMNDRYIMYTYSQLIVLETFLYMYNQPVDV